jgi:ATP-binding cassette subfamily B protein
MLPDRSFRFWVPEVIQSSLMDCGPAALQAVSQGCGVSVDYDLIRERCCTDVDGTSIYALAKLGNELGLSASQVLVPRDTLLLESARCLPAIVVTETATGVRHFVVVWRIHGPLVQIMDPATGRQFIRRTRFLGRLPDVPVAIEVDRFLSWTRSSFARDPLAVRLRSLGVSNSRIADLVGAACDSSGWRDYARLDAATRMVATMVESRALRRGREAAGLLVNLVRPADRPTIPAAFYWVVRGMAPETLTVRGAPIVRFLPATRARTLPSSTVSTVDRSVAPAVPYDHAPIVPARSGVLPSDAASVTQVSRDVLTRDQGALPYFLLLGVGLVAGLNFLDSVLLQGLLQAPRHLSQGLQRVLGVLIVLMPTISALALEFALARGLSRHGRRLEVRLRAALFEKLPRLPDEYLRTRSTADMAQRGHALHLIRGVPATVQRATAAVCELLLSVAGICYLFPEGSWLVLGASAFAVVTPLVVALAVTEHSQRAHAHNVALDRFNLDAFIGSLPIRTHGAEFSMRREHEGILVEWARASRLTLVHTTLSRIVAALGSTGLGIALVILYQEHHAGSASLLLLVYWLWRVPSAGNVLVDCLVIYTTLRHTLARVLAPLRAREPSAVAAERPGTLLATGSPRGVTRALATRVALAMKDVHLIVNERPILRGVSFDIPAGQHVAVVGASGAGKSSLVNLVLGWMTPTTGEVHVDGKLASEHELSRLRQRTVWVDPTIQLWNRSVLDNATYGCRDCRLEDLAGVVQLSELGNVLEVLPEGLQTSIGESGGRLSGGQGQRVRVARGLLRSPVSLVLLDEAFRGIERPLRRVLLRRLREKYHGVTMLCVSHDIEETTMFDRVLVVDQGTIVADGDPRELRSRASSPYAALLLAEAEQAALAPEAWKGIHLDAGLLQVER